MVAGVTVLPETTARRGRGEGGDTTAAAVRLLLLSGMRWRGSSEMDKEGVVGEERREGKGWQLVMKIVRKWGLGLGFGFG